LGRPREFDEEKVLWAAAQTFWDRGYHATSIDDLCRATGLLRGSLYAAYGDKRRMLLAALALYGESRIARLAQSLEAKKPTRATLRNALLYYVRASSYLNHTRACFITNTTLELLPQDRKVGQLIGQIMHRMANLWAAAAVRAQAAGCCRLKMDERAVGNFLLCVVQGLRVMRKIYSEKELTPIIEMTLRAIEA
jgi:TetR/AcrR family transcriptional repressor of nem operon